MKLKVLIGYNDKELDRYVSLGEIIEVTEARDNVLEEAKDYLGRNIVERIIEDKNKKSNKLNEGENKEPDKQEANSQEDDNQDPEKEKQESENMDAKNLEEENKSPKNIDQKNGKNGSKNEEGVP